MSDFTPGLVARHDAAAAARIQALPPPTFAAVNIRERAASAPVSFSPQAGPRHFSPADPAARPTEGWNPLDPNATATSFLDPLAAARAAGYAEGLAAAAQAAAEDDARDRSLVAALLDQLASSGRVDREATARRLHHAVMALVTRVVGDVAIPADLLARRVEAAAALLADKAESAMLRIHPDDAALLEGRLPATISVAGDAGLARGSFVLESASTLVEDGPDLWLEQLARAIDAVPVPPAC